MYGEILPVYYKLDNYAVKYQAYTWGTLSRPTDRFAVGLASPDRLSDRLVGRCSVRAPPIVIA